jgi:hypothetical protein
MTLHVIDKKIVSFKVLAKENVVEIPAEEQAEILSETTKRPAVLEGKTYKLQVPIYDHSIYVTINDIVLNAGTANEERRPYEIFLNSKNLESFQWVTALTRLVSAIFRKGGNISFIVDELQAIFDPHGGYFKPGGKRVPSLVADIGNTIEQHLQALGMISTSKSAEMEAFLEEKRLEFNSADGTYPAYAKMCPKCNTKALVLLDGCSTCLECGDSKCQ